MAITRTQIAKQLLEQGGRVGLRGGGADLGAGASGMGSGTTGNDNRERGMEESMRQAQRRADLGALANRGADDKLQEQLEKFRDLGNRNSLKNKLVNFIPGVGILNRVFGPFNNRDYMLDKMSDRQLQNFANLDEDTKDTVYDSFMEEQRNRFTSNESEGADTPIIPQTLMAQAPSIVEEDDYYADQGGNPFTNRIPYRLMNEGGMADKTVGGIMDLESSRQMYGLGKLVKKVTRSVKKIAKSPIGKVAIAAGLAGMPFGGGSFFGSGSLFGKAKPFLMDNLFGKVTDLGISGPNRAKRVGGLFDLIGGKVGAGILGASALAGLMTPKQEEEDDEEFYRGKGLDLANIRANPGAFQAPRFMAEGGSTEEKEPVAKKVMPLLDMDGKEKDYRETGGFVDMGRMEKADDVPARLSKNEFVFTADAVRNAGDGSVDKGAEVMYNMMKNLESGGDVSEESQGLEGARDMFQTSQRLEEVL